MNKVREFPPLTKLMDEGIQKEIDDEIQRWNTRTNIERFPLSPSQGGKCALALARNLAHYLGVADYPRTRESLQPRTKRIFSRGDLLEDALIADINKFTPLKITEGQRRVKLFTLSPEHAIEGAIDGIAVHEQDGTRILVDFKSKGAFYSAGFTDSISEFFIGLRSTGLVEEIAPNSFLITDAKALFDVLSLDDFFVDYLLQLNSYAFAEGVNVDFVALYYENKNTCANYEVRWTPNKELFEYVRSKFQYVYETVRTAGPERVPKEFALGSTRCRLCEHNERCWGKYNPQPSSRVVGKLDEGLDRAFRAAERENHVVDKVKEAVLTFMMKNDLTHIQTSDGLIYERKFLKSPKPHFELRLSK